jgi:HD superfamily phosphohydrolase
MRTFAVTMQSDVLRIEKESDPKLKSQLMNSLGMYVNLYFDVLKISEKVSTEALKMIAGGHFKLETDTKGYKTLEIFEDKEILSVSIFIPSKITDSEEAKLYASTQFENSIKLARFSMEYLAYMQPELNNPLDLDLLFKHPSAQAQFVRALHQKELR